MKLSFVISTQPTKFQAVAFDPNFESNVAYLATLGYDGVEVAVREPAKLDSVHVKSVLAAQHLEVPAIGTGQAYVEEQLSFTDRRTSVREAALERVESHIALACEFVIASEAKQSPVHGVEIASSQTTLLAMTEKPIVILGLIRGKLQAEVSAEEVRAWLIDALKRVARVAREKNMRLAIEPINRYETDLVNNVADALVLIEAVSADNVGILFDTFHANIEEPSMETSLRACGARLFHVHVADSNRWAPGAGHTDFVRIITVLREMNYSGWVSAEILPKPDIRRAAEQTIKTIKPLL
jgi:sugar phosphate isomerase/epimerase